ncbi:MAG TPA: ATP-binding protein [Chloroflexota bacterium]|nr:ATP-binding protein [Chloroflexota bacterium]
MAGKPQQAAPPAGRLSTPAQVYLYLVALSAAVIIAYWLLAWQGPLLPQGPGLITMVMLVVLGILAQHFPLVIGPRYKVDVSIAVYFACLLRFGAPVALVLVGVSHLVGQTTMAMRRNPVSGVRLRTPRSVVFNTAQFVLATGLGGLAYFSILPHLAPAPLERLENLWAIPAAAVVMYATNTLAVAVMIGLQRRLNPMTIWRSSQARDALEFSGLFLIGHVTALTSVHYPWAPLVMALPAVFLHRSLEQTMQLLSREQAARAGAEAAAERIRGLQTAIEQDWAPLAAVLAGMSDGVIVLDAAHQVRFCNEQAGKLLDMVPAAAVGQPAMALIDRLGPRLTDAQAGQAIWEQIITRPQEQRSGELTLRGPARRVILVSAFPVADAGGERLGLVLRDVTDAKVRAILEERERIAMDLHDGVIQSLYGVVLALGAHERRADGHANVGADHNGNGRQRNGRQRNGRAGNALLGHDQAHHARVGEAGNGRAGGGEAGSGRAAMAPSGLRQEITRLNRVIQEIRNYIFDLRSPGPYAGSLQAGLAAVVEELRLNRSMHVRLALAVDAVTCLGPDAVADVLHVAREATSNVVRHAEASAITLSLSEVDERLVLSVRDDGKGFEPQRGQNSNGHGLRNMAERARALGGQLSVLSEPGGGTEIRLEVPLEVPLRKERWDHDESLRATAAGG